VRVLVTGDKHLGLVSDGVARLEEQARVLRAIVELASELKPDVYVDLGDLFNSPSPGPEAYAVALEYLLPLSRRVSSIYVLAGNHDKRTRGSVNSLLPLEALARDDAFAGRVEVITEPILVREGSEFLFLLPFVTEAEARERGAFEDSQSFLDRFAEGELESGLPRKARALAFAHLEVPGAKRGPDDVTQRDVGTSIPRALLEDPRVLRVYAGHVHHHQELDRVTVVGSSIHVDFGEARSPKGVVLAEV